MKIVAVLAILLISYYMTMSKVALSQLQALQDFYSHIEEYSSQAASGPTAQKQR